METWILGSVAGLVCGLIPLALAKTRNLKVFGFVALLGCILSGIILGVILALPVAIAFCGLIFLVPGDGTAITLSLFFGAVVAVAGWHFADRLITVPEPPEEVLPMREFTSIEGTTITARLLANDGKIARIERSDGEVFELPVERLVPTDQIYLLDHVDEPETPVIASPLALWTKLFNREATLTVIEQQSTP